MEGDGGREAVDSDRHSRPVSESHKPELFAVSAVCPGMIVPTHPWPKIRDIHPAATNCRRPTQSYGLSQNHGPLVWTRNPNKNRKQACKGPNEGPMTMEPHINLTWRFSTGAATCLRGSSLIPKTAETITTYMACMTLVLYWH